MKIDAFDEENEETNYKLNPVVENAIDEMHQIQSNEIYHASLISLSSSWVK